MITYLNDDAEICTERVRALRARGCHLSFCSHNSISAPRIQFFCIGINNTQIRQTPIVNFTMMTSRFLSLALLLAAVGQLQFEVVQARLKNEYGVESLLEPLSYSLARWVDGGWEAVDKADADGKLFGIMIVQDRWKRPVLLFRNDWKASALAEEEKYLELKPWSKPPLLDA